MRDPLIERRPGMILAEVGGELVGLHVDTAVCYGFNPTAARIWALVEAPRRLSDLCAALAAEFDADPAVLRADTRALIEELARDGLLALSPA